METKSYDFNWIRFLSNQVPVKVCNEADFAQFKRFLLSKGLIGILKDDLEFKDWVLLTMVNHKNPKLFLFEYSNSKGLTWSDNEEEAFTWYGEICKPEDLWT